MSSVIKTVFGFLATFLALILILGGLGIAGFLFLNSSPKEEPRVEGLAGIYLERDGSYLLEIRPGESAVGVGKRLEVAGFIRSALLWNIIARVDGNFLKAGFYAIQGIPTQLQLWTFLISGQQALVKVTIPEGVTLKKMAAILENAGITSSEDFLEATKREDLLNHHGIPSSSMEGFLYPDTYLFPRAYPAEKVIGEMVETFFERLYALAPRAEELAPEELFQRVIIASIVEREYRVPDEAAIMAGVFYNRQKKGMRLESCATVQYVLTEILNQKHPEFLTHADLAIMNPYNTYRFNGLPPGPISAPGEVALEAAFYPKASDYLYFRLTNADAGRHTFSQTLEDHNRAGRLYIKRSASTR